jgi:fructose-1-phosphate kinase PfkB-like protein
MKITILEFAPCIDAIYHMRRDAEEGYLSGDGSTVTIRSGAKLRPVLATTYAGGKATNVARVIDRLLDEDDRAEVELVVFRPDSPEGQYIHALQTGALGRVRVTPVIVPSVARFCIDLIDPASDRDARVEFNISPRAVWEAQALDIAMEFAREMTADLLLLAGNPPMIGSERRMAAELYASIIEQARDRTGVISIDTEKEALARCLASPSKPDVVKINSAEHRSVATALWQVFSGTLIVTDAGGCRARAVEGREIYVRGASVADLYSTLGAGDAFHAGFTLARWVRGYDLIRACRYGQAAAASSVSSVVGTRGVTRAGVERFFLEVERQE